MRSLLSPPRLDKTSTKLPHSRVSTRFSDAGPIFTIVASTESTASFNGPGAIASRVRSGAAHAAAASSTDPCAAAHRPHRCTSRVSSGSSSSAFAALFHFPFSCPFAFLGLSSSAPVRGVKV